MFGRATIRLGIGPHSSFKSIKTSFDKSVTTSTVVKSVLDVSKSDRSTNSYAAGHLMNVL